MGDKLPKRLVLVGIPEEHHVGAHLLAAAGQLGWEATLMDTREAHSRNLWVNRLFHRLLNRRPAHLNRFSKRLVELCRKSGPELLLATGISAPRFQALKEIGEMRIHRANFLTDDPWNPRNGAAFFWPAMREYDSIWSPRRANLKDLRGHGCQGVEYLPFGYNPALHFPETPQSAAERERFDCDVVFVGGADADRLPMARTLLQAGLKVHLYGGYWDRDAELRPCWRGFAQGRDLRLAVGVAKVNICLGRRANRDGHAMRSLELPAMGGCLVVEDTEEHREIFGDEGATVTYFNNPGEMAGKAKWLLEHPYERERLKKAARQHIAAGHNTYADRLTRILIHLEDSCS
jgi:glycosyltransferase involved in cell wall biosynthesis